MAPWIAGAATEAGVHPLRLHPLNGIAVAGQPPAAGAPVILWVQNAQRAADNPALDLAAALAGGSDAGVTALFVLDGRVPFASERTFTFLLEGLAELGPRLRERRVPFVLRAGSPVEEVTRAVVELGAGVVVTDLSPLQRGRRLRAQAGKALLKRRIPVIAVDTEHVVPLLAVPGEQIAARTLRPRFWRWLGLSPPGDGPQADVPRLPLLPAAVVARRSGRALDGLSLPGSAPAAPSPGASGTAIDGAAAVGSPLRFEPLFDSLGVDRTIRPVPGMIGGELAAARRLEDFLDWNLAGYGGRAPGGTADAADDRASGMSPYLRYGQISPWRVAYQIAGAPAPESDRNAFLEELLVRRELAANFCWYNPHYRNLAAVPAWARETLRLHAVDPRPFLYTPEQFERAETHDPLWNAAQRQLMRSGRIQGYLRMYWGKMLLAWSPSPEEALHTALTLNDRYALDGRSANGATNILWCFGKHDRPFPERDIFGVVRSMTAAGVARKFRLERYLHLYGT
ncbi:MAG: deoxyribodipyrimidine photo-lyase [Chloroflexota bacterium]|nr:deoxyribodipyrimidine photo-lyase [Chloroflexota bacterium]